ncbi:hypothetical protein GCM10025866_00680 [Naasia aerilata]|uniref:Uncharacterized protein n=1 Tax=Naasia aerilata TaxID=1162966 RepID=A0ABM8G7L6_9MICO|nr:hypothetical protein GCM10025866_00680 [Naasia aerilata]
MRQQQEASRERCDEDDRAAHQGEGARTGRSRGCVALRGGRVGIVLGVVGQGSEAVSPVTCSRAGSTWVGVGAAEVSSRAGSPNENGPCEVQEASPTSAAAAGMRLSGSIAVIEASSAASAGVSPSGRRGGRTVRAASTSPRVPGNG